MSWGLIRAGIESDPRIQVVGEAGNAAQARDAVKSLNPDVMTLDVEMPGMSGIDFLARLMRARPMPAYRSAGGYCAGSERLARAGRQEQAKRTRQRVWRRR